MSGNRASIIADGSSLPGRRRTFWIIFAAAVVAGAAAAVHYASRDLTLSHYDARAHLVVARRVIDSLTPGWRQLGGVWLPLPHLMNVLPVQWDWAYRTGVTAVALSVVVLSWGLGRLGQYLHRTTGSIAAALVAPALVLANPNVLYLQSTPMTEPLLIGFALVALAAVDEYGRAPVKSAERRAGWSLAALVLVRYEGWLIAAGLLVIVTLALIRREPRRALALWRYPLGAIALFLAVSRGSTGDWMQTSGFFVAENPSLHQPLAALNEVWTATGALAGPALVWIGIAGVAVCLFRARSSVASLLPLSLAAAALLPLLAFYQGHPHRVRYMVPLVAASGALAGLAIGTLPVRAGSRPLAWLRASAAVALLAVTAAGRLPLSRTAPMVEEAQWETPFRLERRDVTSVLREIYDGTPILASMGSLGHYMQEVSSIGLTIGQFVHEGNGDLWVFATDSPRSHVRWVLIEERAEGGDTLAARAREDPAFLDGFVKMAEGGGLVLYARR